MMTPELKRRVKIKVGKTVKLISFLEWAGGRSSFSEWPHYSQQQNKVKMFIYFLLKYILKSKT